MSVSALGRVQVHTHPVPALLVGVDGPILYREGARAIERATLFIPAGRRHGLDCGPGRVLTLFLTMPGRRFAALPKAAAATRLRELARGAVDEPVQRADLDAAKGAPLLVEAAAELDPRVRVALSLIRGADHRQPSLRDIEDAVGLSGSRVMHLFQSQLGASFRQVRTWDRMRRVVQVRAGGESLTSACLAAGFADSSHFSHVFRRTFGMVASTVLGRGARVRVPTAEVGGRPGAIRGFG